MIEYLFINSRDELLRLDVSKIIYLEADGNYTNIYSANKLKSVVCMTLGKIQELINFRIKDQATLFARVGKKHIVNLRYVHSINTIRQKLILSDDYIFAYQLDVSKDALKMLKSVFVELANNE